MHFFKIEYASDTGMFQAGWLLFKRKNCNYLRTSKNVGGLNLFCPTRMLELPNQMLGFCSFSIKKTQCCIEFTTISLRVEANNVSLDRFAPERCLDKVGRALFVFGILHWRILNILSLAHQLQNVPITKALVMVALSQ